MAIEPKSRLIIRCDWETAIRNESSVWTTFKKPDGSIQGCLKRRENVQEGDQVLEGGGGFSAKLLPNGQLELKYKGEGGEITSLMRSPSQQLNCIHPPKKNINSLDVSDKGLGVSCDSDGSLLVWQSDSGEIKHRLQGHSGEVSKCKFFPSGVVVLSGGVDMRLKIWSAEEAYCAATLIGHTRGISDFSFIERGRNFISSSRDATLRLWDCSQSQTLHTFFSSDSKPINCCQVQPAWEGLKLIPPSSSSSSSSSSTEQGTEGKVVVAGTEGGKLEGWAVQNKNQIFNHSSHSPINTITFPSPHHCIYGTDDSTLHLIDLRNTREAVRVVKETRGAILSLYAPHADCVFVATADGSCYSVNPSDLTLKSELTGSDLDPVREVTADTYHVFTACRDGVIRKYQLL